MQIAAPRFRDDSRVPPVLSPRSLHWIYRCSLYPLFTWWSRYGWWTGSPGEGSSSTGGCTLVAQTFRMSVLPTRKPCHPEWYRPSCPGKRSGRVAELRSEHDSLEQAGRRCGRVSGV